jgi:hypothetical protein
MKLRFALPILLVVLSVFAVGQTTYNSSTPFLCDAASHYPVSSFSQFACRGIEYGSNQVELFFWGTPRIELFDSAVPFTLGPYTSSLTLIGFSQPVSGQPGSYSFSWSGTDSNGIQRSGSASGTWKNAQDWRGWYHPKILSSSLTVN